MILAFTQTILPRDRPCVERKQRADRFRIVRWIEKNVVESIDEDAQPVETVGREQKLGMAG